MKSVRKIVYFKRNIQEEQEGFIDSRESDDITYPNQMDEKIDEMNDDIYANVL